MLEDRQQSTPLKLLSGMMQLSICKLFYAQHFLFLNIAILKIYDFDNHHSKNCIKNSYLSYFDDTINFKEDNLKKTEVSKNDAKELTTPKLRQKLKKSLRSMSRSTFDSVIDDFSHNCMAKTEPSFAWDPWESFSPNI